MCVCLCQQCDASTSLSNKNGSTGPNVTWVVTAFGTSPASSASSSLIFLIKTKAIPISELLLLVEMMRVRAPSGWLSSEGGVTGNTENLSLKLCLPPYCSSELRDTSLFLGSLVRVQYLPSGKLAQLGSEHKTSQLSLFDFLCNVFESAEVCVTSMRLKPHTRRFCLSILYRYRVPRVHLLNASPWFVFVR
jgi:hypothetical protein